jgi:hypothetical protein
MRTARAAAVIVFVALVTNVFVVGAASADNRHRLTGRVTHSTASDLNPRPHDAFCVENDPVLGPVVGTEQDWKLWLGARELIRLRVCYEFTGGAMGGNDLRGVWTLLTAEGTLTGELQGVAAHAGFDHISMTLTPTEGTRGLRQVHGALAFVGCNTFTHPNPIRGVVTTPGTGLDPGVFCPSQ